MSDTTRYQWIGKIPDDWNVLKISHTTYVKGRIGWHGLNTDDFIDEGAYCVTGTDLKDGIIDWSTCYHVSEERYNQDPFIQLKEEDLLLTKDGTIGKCGIVVGLEGKATLNSGLFVIRPEKDSYITRFLYWIIQSQVFDNFITLTKTGTTISHLYQNVFEGFRFPVPKAKTQKQIADFLDKETTRIDTLITKKQKQIELLQEKRQAIITQSVTKGLNPDVKMKDSGIEWIGEIPEHWDDFPLKWGVKVGSGSFLSNEEIESDITDEHLIPVIGGNGVMGYSKISNQSEKTLVVGRVGALCGNVHLINEKSWVTDNALIVKLRNNLSINQNYLSYLLTIRDLNRDANKNAQPLITGTMIKSVKVPLPKIKEQEEIVRYIRKEMIRIDELSKKVIVSIDLLKEYRSSLITHAVSGQIDISKYEVTK